VSRYTGRGERCVDIENLERPDQILECGGEGFAPGVPVPREEVRHLQRPSGAARRERQGVLCPGRPEAKARWIDPWSDAQARCGIHIGT
jgi:hypothetical protein